MEEFQTLMQSREDAKALPLLR